MGALTPFALWGALKVFSFPLSVFRFLNSYPYQGATVLESLGNLGSLVIAL